MKENKYIVENPNCKEVSGGRYKFKIDKDEYMKEHEHREVDGNCRYAFQYKLEDGSYSNPSYQNDWLISFDRLEPTLECIHIAIREHSKEFPKRKFVYRIVKVKVVEIIEALPIEEIPAHLVWGVDY